MADHRYILRYVPLITVEEPNSKCYYNSMKILLKEVRKRRRLSLRQLEIMTGVPRSTLSRIENEESSPTLEMIEEIAKGMHMKITDLFQSEYK